MKPEITKNDKKEKEVEIMFCENCGKELVGSNAFCTNCGAPVAGSANTVHKTNTAAQFTGGMSNGAAANGATTKQIMPNVGNAATREEHAPEAKMVMWICAALSMVATFLPFITASAFGYSQSTTMVESGVAGFIYVFAIITIVLTIFPKTRNLTVIPSGIVLLYMFAILASSNDSVGYGESASMGIGYWIMTLGNIAILVEAIRYRRAK